MAPLKWIPWWRADKLFTKASCNASACSHVGWIEKLNYLSNTLTLYAQKLHFTWTRTSYPAEAAFTVLSFFLNKAHDSTCPVANSESWSSDCNTDWFALIGIVYLMRTGFHSNRKTWAKESWKSTIATCVGSSWVIDRSKRIPEATPLLWLSTPVILCKCVNGCLRRALPHMYRPFMQLTGWPAKQEELLW